MNNCVLYPDVYEFSSKIISIQYNQKEDRTIVQLEKSYFFPMEGGQPSDKGSIDKYQLKQAIIEKKHSTNINHIIDGKTDLQIDQIVNCKIDKQFRHMNAITHTGQHLFSAYADKMGCTSESFTIQYPYSVIELHRQQKITQEEINQLIIQTNQSILDNYQIETKIIYNLDEIPENLRKNYSIIPLRLVSIKNGNEIIDICPCCGSHVQSTNELGSFMIWKCDQIKNGVRVQFSFGQQNVLNLIEHNNVLQQCCQLFNTGTDAVVESIQKTKLNLKNTEKKLSDTIKNQQNPILQSSFIEFRNDVAIIFNDYLSEKDIVQLPPILQEQQPQYQSVIIVTINQAEKQTIFSIMSKNKQSKEIGQIIQNKYNDNIVKQGGNDKRYNLVINKKLQKKDMNFN